MAGTMFNPVARILVKRCFHNPIFIVGTGRSGTSVLLQALGKHPEILAMPGEAPLLTTFGSIGYLFEEAEEKNYYNASLRMPKDRLYEKLQQMCFEIAGGDNYAIKTIIASFKDGEGWPWKKKFWCCKTFPPQIIANGLRQLFPAAKFVYILRNGLDVVQSMTKFHGFHDREFITHCASWNGSIDTYRYLLACDVAIVVRHEELVAQPAEVFEKIFNLLGIETHANSVKFVRTTLVHPLDMPNTQVSSAGKVLLARDPPYSKWSSEQKDVFKNICGEAMHEAGYEIPF